MKKYISKALKELRKTRKYSQTKLGNVLGVSRSKVSSWEVGRRDLSLCDAVLICNYYNICLDTLLCPEKISYEKIINLIEKYLDNLSTSKTEKETIFFELEKLLKKKKCLF